MNINPTLIVGIIIITGFIFGEFAAKIWLPKVTGYILAGILLNPGLLPIIPLNFVEHTSLITNLSLSIITFSVGGTLHFSRIKKFGKGILSITIFEAEFAFLAVIIGFLIIAPLLIKLPNATLLTTYIPLSLLIGCLASPTDPSATLAVVHEYKAQGKVTSTIMGVAAFDDVLGIINYSLAISFAQMFVLHQGFTLYAMIFTPLAAIFGALVMGLICGFLFNLVTGWINKESEGVLIVVILGLLSLCFGISNLLGLDELLATMAMGIIVVNFNPKKERIFVILERYTEQLIFVLFFTLSGMHLQFSVLASSYMLVILFAVFRALGKTSGAFIGATMANAPSAVKKYTAGGLIPQGGIVIGLALMIKQNSTFSAFADLILNVILGATVVHELIGPLFSRHALKKAKEINP